jgi:hypothetical protein
MVSDGGQSTQAGDHVPTDKEAVNTSEEWFEWGGDFATGPFPYPALSRVWHVMLCRKPPALARVTSAYQPPLNFLESFGGP